MGEYFAIRIVQAFEEGGIEAGHAKYLSYYGSKVKMKLYGKYQPDTDEKLEQMGHKELIVQINL